MAQGFFRSVCSLGGLVLGLGGGGVELWPRRSACFLPLVRIDAVANAIAFLLIALLVMAAVRA